MGVMQMRTVARFASLAAISIVTSAQAGPSTNALRIKAVDFYRWCLSHGQGNKAPILNDQIESHVASKLIDHLRSDYRQGRLAENADHFLKVQDYDDTDWAAHISAGLPSGPPDDQHLLVTIGSAGRVELCVHMTRTDHVWKVARVDPEGVAPASSNCRARISEAP